MAGLGLEPHSLESSIPKLPQYSLQPPSWRPPLIDSNLIHTSEDNQDTTQPSSRYPDFFPQIGKEERQLTKDTVTRGYWVAGVIQVSPFAISFSVHSSPSMTIYHRASLSLLTQCSPLRFPLLSLLYRGCFLLFKSHARHIQLHSQVHQPLNSPPGSLSMNKSENPGYQISQIPRSP
jgi:hypothetical protein